MTRPPASAAAGPNVNEPIGGFHQLQVVLDNHQRMSDVEQRVEAVHQLYDVDKVQTGCRLIEQKERAAVSFGREVDGEFRAAGLRRRESVVAGWPSRK